MKKLNTAHIQSYLQKHGGGYLRTIREWIQRKFINGERVTWGSQDQLRGSLNVLDLERAALDVAVCAIYDNTTELIDICSICLNRGPYPWRNCKYEGATLSSGRCSAAYKNRKCFDFILAPDNFITCKFEV